MSLCVSRCHRIQLWGSLIITMDNHQDAYPSMRRWKQAHGQLTFLLMLHFLVLYLLALSLSVWGCLLIWKRGAVFGAKIEIKVRNILFPRRDQKERPNGTRDRERRRMKALAWVLTRRLLASCNECRSALQHFSGVFQHLNNLVSSLPLVALFVTSVDLHADCTI